MPHLSPINWLILIFIFWLLIISYLNYYWWQYLSFLIVVEKNKQKTDLIPWYEISIISTNFFQK